jgi:transcription antitermination factor NusG
MFPFRWFALRVTVGQERHLQAITSHMTRGKLWRLSCIAAPVELDKHNRVKVLYPGYLFLRIRLEDDSTIPTQIRSFFCNFPHCEDFVGHGNIPAPVDQKLFNLMVSEEDAALLDPLESNVTCASPTLEQA